MFDRYSKSKMPKIQLINISLSLPEEVNRYVIAKKSYKKYLYEFSNIGHADKFVDDLIMSLLPEVKDKKWPVLYLKAEIILEGEDIICFEIPLNENNQIMSAYDRRYGMSSVSTKYISILMKDEINRKLMKYNLYGGMAFSEITSFILLGQELPKHFLRYVLKQGLLDNIIGDLSHDYILKNYYEFNSCPSPVDIHTPIGIKRSNKNPEFDIKLCRDIFAKIYDLVSESFANASIGPGNTFINSKFKNELRLLAGHNTLAYFVQSLTTNEIIFCDGTCISLGDRIENRIQINPMMRAVRKPMKIIENVHRQGILLKIFCDEKMILMGDINDPTDKSRHSRHEIIDIKKMD